MSGGARETSSMGQHDRSDEEDDLLRRSKRRNKGSAVEMNTESMMEGVTENGNKSYKDADMGSKGKESMFQMDEALDGEISDDNFIEESMDDSWFGIGMTREEKREARRPWWNSLFIKIVGHSIGCHYLWRRIQAMWRTQIEPLLIDLGNEFFIVK